MLELGQKKTPTAVNVRMKAMVNDKDGIWLAADQNHFIEKE